MFGALELTPLDASPFLIFSALGVWGTVFLVRNYFSDNAFYTIRAARFYKVHAPRWFLLFTLFYLTVASLFIAGPIWLVASLAKT